MSCLDCLNHKRWRCFVEIMLQLGLKEEIWAHASQDCKWFLTGRAVTKEVTKRRGVLCVLQGRGEPCLNTWDCLCVSKKLHFWRCQMSNELTSKIIKNQNKLFLLINKQWVWATCKVLYSTLIFTLSCKLMCLVPRRHCLKLFVVSLGDTLEF